MMDKKPKFLKTDVWLACVAGEAIAILALPILKNLGLIRPLFAYGRAAPMVFILFWLFFVPAAAVLGLYLFYRAALVWKASIFEIGKYGITGWLNVFVNIGVFNFFSWIFGVVGGLGGDAIVVVAFIVTLTNAFFWNKLWTFESKNSGNGKKEYLGFFIVSGITAILNTLLFHVIVNVIGAPAGVSEKLWANAAIVFSVPLAFFCNFFGYKIFVFRKQSIIAGIE